MTQESRVWTLEQDQILRMLREQRMITKWSLISHIMEDQFHIRGCNGKRCRERYENHLNSEVKKEEWTFQEEKRLLELHNFKGNKWVEIAKELERTDNAVKNHYHSKLRKALRKINKCISDHCLSQLKPLKNIILSRIVQCAEEYYLGESGCDWEQAVVAFNLKNKILKQSQLSQQQLTLQQIKEIQSLVSQIQEFNQQYKKTDKTPTQHKIPSNKYKGKEIISLLEENANLQVTNNSRLTLKSNDKHDTYAESEEQQNQIQQPAVISPPPAETNIAQSGWDNMAIYNNGQAFIIFNQGLFSYQPICLPFYQQSTPIFSGKHSSFSSYSASSVDKISQPTLCNSQKQMDFDEYKQAILNQ